MRDAVLGVRCLTAGEVLRFGGQGMKNVAGFDLSRLLCGAFGTLAILSEVSRSRSCPRPSSEITLTGAMGIDQAIPLINRWARGPLPLSGVQRWLKTDAGAEEVRRSAAEERGYAVLFRGGDQRGEVFPPLPDGLGALHARLKDVFDPRRILSIVAVCTGISDADVARRPHRRSPGRSRVLQPRRRGNVYLWDEKLPCKLPPPLSPP